MNKRPAPVEWDDNPELTDEQVAAARAASEVLGPAATRSLARKPGRPKLDAADRKQPVSIRLSPDVLRALRDTGDGWQTKVDGMLRSALGLDALAKELTKREGKQSAGTTLFERMANMSRGSDSGRFETRNDVDANSKTGSREGKRRA